MKDELELKLLELALEALDTLEYLINQIPAKVPPYWRGPFYKIADQSLDLLRNLVHYLDNVESAEPGDDTDPGDGDGVKADDTDVNAVKLDEDIRTVRFSDGIFLLTVFEIHV